MDGAVNVRGRVEGDVVSVSGPVNVAGGVTGVISALSERVTLTPTARVRRPALCGETR